MAAGFFFWETLSLEKNKKPKLREGESKLIYSECRGRKSGVLLKEKAAKKEVMSESILFSGGKKKIKTEEEKMEKTEEGEETRARN